MLSGRELTIFVRDTSIREVEDHIGSLYAMRSEELSGTLGALVGGVVGGVVSVGVAMMQTGVPAEKQTEYQLVLGFTALLLTVMGIFSMVAIHQRLAKLHKQAGWAKDLAACMCVVYKP
jgi:hypothetical protein